MIKKLNKIFKNSKRIIINDESKIVIMSDCHRGNGKSYDNFLKNKNIFNYALNHYYNNNFVYIELGDGDDMWEVKNYKDIVKEHLETFKILKKFNDSNRLIMIYGNHDIYKRYPVILKETFYNYYDQETKKEANLLNNLKVYESLVLDYKGFEVFMIHGHQVDFLNSRLWRLSRFLVRYVWRILEYIGLKDPTDIAKNYPVTKRTDKKLRKWSVINNKILIAGHTHRPIFSNDEESLYFNDGSCIHPDGITSLEIEKGSISLVKWTYRIDSNYKIIEREVLEEKELIKIFFDKTHKEN